MNEDLAGLGKVGVRLIESGEKFLERLVGPWLDEKGQSLADGVRARRRRNAETVAGMASAIAGDREVGPVPGRILFPMLEAASNEEDPGLQEKWAALLANTATGDVAATLGPAFVDIMRQLTPLHAKVLAFLYKRSRMLSRTPRNPKAPGYRHQFFGNVARESVLREFPMPVLHYNELAEDLYRMRLLEGGQLGLSIAARGGPVVHSTFAQVTLTQRAHEFLTAVSSPGTDLGGVILEPIPDDHPLSFASMTGQRPKRPAKKKAAKARTRR